MKNFEFFKERFSAKNIEFQRRAKVSACRNMHHCGQFLLEDFRCLKSTFTREMTLFVLSLVKEIRV